MSSIKEKILKKIEGIDDETLLLEVHTLLNNIQDTRQVLQLNPEQRSGVQEAREDYKAGRHKSTDELFDDLIND
jgi:hypothetical protein